MACALALASPEAVLSAPPPDAKVTPKPAAKAPFRTHTVVAGETLYSIATRYQVTVSDLVTANKLHSPYTLAPGQVIVLPDGAVVPQPVAAAAGPVAFRTHLVASGDTPTSVAERYGVSVEDLARANHLRLGEPLKPGGILAVPVSDVTGATPEAVPTSHIVRRGDTPYNIARRYGITVQDLERANHLVPPYSLYLGSVLTLPAGATGGAKPILREEASSELRVHTVAPGDTVYSIARRYGRSVDAIKQLNKLQPPYTLTVGTLILIPEEGAPIIAAPAPVPPTPVPTPAPTPTPVPVQPAPPPVAEAPKPQEVKPAEIPREGPLASAEFNLTAAIRGAFNTKSGQIQAADVRLDPSFSMSLFDGWTFNTKARFVADAEDRLERGRPDQLTRAKINRRLLIGDRAELELREAYLHGKAADIDWTIGKQSIVWGEADGLKVLDVVDPQSYREFILAPFDQSRIPRWSVRAEKRLGDTTLEGVVLFDNTYNEYAPLGSSYDVVSAKLRPLNLFPQVSTASAQALFSTFSPLIPYQLPPLPAAFPPITIEPPERRGAAHEPDFGGRIKTFFHGWDLSALYYRHTDLDPSLKTTVSLQGITLTPQYNRVNLIGATFANAFGNFTLRGEFGYTTDRVVPTRPDIVRLVNLGISSPSALLSVLNQGTFLDSRVKRDDLSYVLGVDYFGIPNTMVSVQFFQESILDPPPELLQPKTSYSGTFYVRRTALNEKLLMDFQAIVNFTEHDAVIRPKVKYELRDNLSAYVGADIFLGSRNGIFGAFKDESRVVTGIELNM